MGHPVQKALSSLERLQSSCSGAGRLVLHYSLVSQVVIHFPRGWSRDRGELHPSADAFCGNSPWSLRAGLGGGTSLLLADGTRAPHRKPLQLVVKLLVYVLPAGYCSYTRNISGLGMWGIPQELVKIMASIKSESDFLLIQ